VQSVCIGRIEMAEGGEDDVAVLEHKRAPKLTERALEEQLHRRIGQRRAKLSALTSKIKAIEKLMIDEENLQNVQDLMQFDFVQLIAEFKDLNSQVQETLPQDEKIADQQNWFQPKMDSMRHFENKINHWIAAVGDKKGQDDKTEVEDDVSPHDSVSQVSVNKRESKKNCDSDIESRSVFSSVSSAYAREESKRAALMARAASLKKKQQLEIERMQLMAKMEELEIETALAESNAKLKVLKEHENSEDGKCSIQSKSRRGIHQKPKELKTEQIDDSSGHSSEKERKKKAILNPVFLVPPQLDTSRDTDHRSNRQADDNIIQIMQKQNELTELLVKQQTQIQLPSKDIQVFTGDPLTFKSFIRSFEHTIEHKTDNEKDKLYYLEQYTAGEPQEIVRSCEYMSSSKGFKEAKRLLQRHYGDELIIASAYIDKALKWPQIKSDDGKALSAYALFLIGCRNTMEDGEFMEEMDNPTNMRVILSKLPYKMKERWRSEAYDIKERQGVRARFTHLVNFIDRQAKVAMDPLFGDIIDHRNVVAEKVNRKEKYPVKKGITRSSFATNICMEERKPQYVSKKQVSPPKMLNAFEKPCMFCTKDHALELCSELKEQPHMVRLEFLKSKGLCFGCLTQGHISKSCKKRMECKECSQKHPDILHIKENRKETKDVELPDRKISCAQVSLNHQLSDKTEYGGDNCVLSIVPVKVKSNKGDRIVETYAFLDAGSTATFCTEELQRKLNLKGKPTQILLSTMCQDKPGEQKLVNSFILTDLEVCALEDTKYFELPKVFTHSSIPVQNENIPNQEDIRKWSYLSQVSIPNIDSNVDLLIGANNSKAMEPWYIINKGNGTVVHHQQPTRWTVCCKNCTRMGSEWTHQKRKQHFTKVQIATSFS